MISWATVAFYLVTSALSYLLTRAQAPKPLERKQGALDAPEAKSDGPVPVIFGTVWVTPNVVWFGDLRVVPIRKKEGGKK